MWQVMWLLMSQVGVAGNRVIRTKWAWQEMGL